MAVNTSVVRNVILVAQLVAMSLLTLVLADTQTRQARYQCENLIFQRHAQMAHSAEVGSYTDDGRFLAPEYRTRMADAWQEWRLGIQACHAANPPLLP